MLPCPGFRDDPTLAHALREKRLTQSVVDLVSTRVGQVFAFQKDSGTAARLGEAPGVRNRRRPTDVVFEEPGELGLEIPVSACVEVGAFEVFDRLDEGFWNEASAEFAEVTANVRVAARQCG